MGQSFHSQLFCIEMPHTYKIDSKEYEFMITELLICTLFFFFFSFFFIMRGSYNKMLDILKNIRYNKGSDSGFKF